jgi:hypothetical protein
MIAFLRGKLLEKHPNQVIVEAGGVGYDVVIPIQGPRWRFGFTRTSGKMLWRCSAS